MVVSARRFVGWLLASGPLGAAALGALVSPRAQANAASQSSRIAEPIIAAPQLNHSLLICNAYAFKAPLHVVTASKKLSSEPIPYKSCQELAAPISEGDTITFLAGTRTVGTFHATGLPKQAASLLLVPYRRSAGSLVAAFQSHAFADLATAQVAVVDAYSGSRGDKVKIMGVPEPVSAKSGDGLNEANRTEDLNYNTIVALNPGRYKIGLAGMTPPEQAAFEPVVVSGRGKYVVIRVGADDANAPVSYPQALIVYPKSAAGRVRSGLLGFFLGAVGLLTSGLDS